MDSEFRGTGSFSSYNDPYQIIFINLSPYKSLSGNNNIIRQQDMEPDRGGKRRGVKDGRGQRVRRVGEFADPEHKRLIVGQGLEREHKSNKRFMPRWAMGLGSTLSHGSARLHDEHIVPTNNLS